MAEEIKKPLRVNKNFSETQIKSSESKEVKKPSVAKKVTHHELLKQQKERKDPFIPVNVQTSIVRKPFVSPAKQKEQINFESKVSKIS